MHSSKNLKIGITVVAASALAAGGAAYANTKHSSKSAGGLTTGVFVSSQSGSTTRADRGHGPGDELAAAATYLGLTATELQTQLQAGKTLGQIADATSGKSKAGLIAALVAAEKDELAAAVKAGRLTQAQSDQIATHLTQRFTDLVNGVRGPGGPDGDHHGHGFGGPPPPGSNGYRALPGTHV